MTVLIEADEATGLYLFCFRNMFRAVRFGFWRTNPSVGICGPVLSARWYRLGLLDLFTRAHPRWFAEAAQGSPTVAGIVGKLRRRVNASPQRLFSRVPALAAETSPTGSGWIK